ncbi:Stigma-specific STIG1-like protein 3 [Linum grandiflorum]
MLLVFVATALSVTLTMQTINNPPQKTIPRISRFLKEQDTTTSTGDGIPGIGGNNGNGVGGGGIKNPKAADHCNNDPGFCESLYGKGFACCNNKCKDLNADKENCGACKSKCKFTNECCNGQCVFLSYDKRHCGKCNSPCAGPGNVCIYGLCNYA